MSNEKIAALRALVKTSPSRPAFHLYAFLRGEEFASLERRVSEHNLPSVYQAKRLWTSLFGAPAPEELSAWLAVPEERIKRYGPRVPRERARRSGGSSILAAGALAAVLSVSSPVAQEPAEDCLDAIGGGALRQIEEACHVREAVADMQLAAK